MKRYTILFSFVMMATVIGLFSCQKSTEKIDLFYPSPASTLKYLSRTIYENPDASIDLTQFEADIRNSLATTSKPNAWQNLDPNITVEEYKRLTTVKLAQICFSTGLLTRYLIAYDKPIYAFSMVKVRFPCFAELFERDDLWQGVLEAYPLYAAGLDPKGEPNKVIDSVMGLNNLPLIFQHPKMCGQLKGREIMFVCAQFEALKKIRSYIKNDADSSTTSSTTFFSVTTPISLVNHSLVFMQKVSPDKSASAVEAISRLRLSKKTKMGEVKKYMDNCISEIQQFLDSNQKSS